MVELSHLSFAPGYPILWAWFRQKLRKKSCELTMSFNCSSITVISLMALTSKFIKIELSFLNFSKISLSCDNSLFGETEWAETTFLILLYKIPEWVCNFKFVHNNIYFFKDDSRPEYRIKEDLNEDSFHFQSFSLVILVLNQMNNIVEDWVYRGTFQFIRI